MVLKMKCPSAKKTSWTLQCIIHSTWNIRCQMSTSTVFWKCWLIRYSKGYISPHQTQIVEKIVYTMLEQVERFHCEIHNEILEKYTNLVCKNLSTVDAGHRSFMIDETTSISLRENISIISDGTTGLCTWQVIKLHASGFMIIASPRNFLLFFCL